MARQLFFHDYETKEIDDSAYRSIVKANNTYEFINVRDKCKITCNYAQLIGGIYFGIIERPTLKNLAIPIKL